MFALTFILITIILVVNWMTARQLDTINRLFDRAVFIFHLVLIPVGALTLFAPPLELLDAGAIIDPVPLGIIALIVGIWGMLASLPGVRQFLARFMPSLQPNSPVHTLTLLFSGYLIANTILTLSQGGLVELANSTDAASISDVISQQLLFAAAAVFGAGFLVRRSWPELVERLGLKRPSATQLFGASGVILVLIVWQWLGGYAAAQLNPEQYEAVSNLSNNLLGEMDTVGEWILFALASGIGEELLFRGALQPILGLWPTAILFAIAHIQYGFSPITLVVLGLGIALGVIRQRSSTTVAIVVHAGYNFTLGMLALLAIYYGAGSP